MGKSLRPGPPSDIVRVRDQHPRSRACRSARGAAARWLIKQEQELTRPLERAGADIDEAPSPDRHLRRPSKPGRGVLRLALEEVTGRTYADAVAARASTSRRRRKLHCAAQETMRTPIICTVVLVLGAVGCAGPNPDSLAAADAAPALLQDADLRAEMEAHCRAQPMDANLRRGIKMVVGKSPATQAEFCRRMMIAMGSGRLSRTQMAELIEGKPSNGTAIVLMKAMKDVPPEA
jgi:hypothetical protein